MNDDHKKKALQNFGQVIDKIAEAHDHSCEVGDMAREISGQVRDTLAAEGGPAQVATPTYRVNYETIFGKRTTVGLS